MTADRATIDAFLAELTSAWKRNDGATFAANFTDDGSLINPFGERADGRAAVTAMYTEYFGGMLAGTTTTIDLTRVRDIEPNHVLMDAEQTIHAPNGDVVLSLHVTNLLRRESGSWRLVDSRPYAFATPPG